MKEVYDFLYKNWKNGLFCYDAINSIIELKKLFKFALKDEDTEKKGWYNYLLKKGGMSEDNIPYALDTLPYIQKQIIVVPDDINERLQWIKDQPWHEQRTPEWFAFRHSCITASFIPKVLGNDSDFDSALKEKISPPVERGGFGNAVKHGVKYEYVAQSIYEHMNDVKISEYGCIRHPTIHFLGASPDGIVTSVKRNLQLLGRMLEIKCVWSRIINGIPKNDYWMQVQLQLAVCNLEFCDFLECFIEETTDEEIFKKKSSNTEYFGIVIDVTHYDSSTERKYFLSGDYDNDLTKLLSAKETYVDEIFKISEIIHVAYYTLESMSCVTIKRNREWFEKSIPRLQKFWDKVEEYRNNEDLKIDFINKEKSKRKSINKQQTLHIKKWLGD